LNLTALSYISLLVGLFLVFNSASVAVVARRSEIGMLRALGEHGRQVPSAVSVVGFDDIPESAFFLPPLTTVRQDFGELGRQALRLLVDRICVRPAPGARMPVAPELIVRASATRPPGR